MTQSLSLCTDGTVQQAVCSHADDWCNCWPHGRPGNSGFCTGLGNEMVFRWEEVSLMHKCTPINPPTYSCLLTIRIMDHTVLRDIRPLDLDRPRRICAGRCRRLHERCHSPNPGPCSHHDRGLIRCAHALARACCGNDGELSRADNRWCLLDIEGTWSADKASRLNMDFSPLAKQTLFVDGSN